MRRSREGLTPGTFCVGGVRGEGRGEAMRAMRALTALHDAYARV